jgi:threonine aldolase
MIDLRSDTVTRPTGAMLHAMMSAEVGDDVYREDPTVRRLEERVAALLGKEVALFVPTGTMANQLALMLHARPGEEVIAGKSAHFVNYESGAGGAWAGVQFAVTPRELFTAGEARALIRAPAYWLPKTRLIGVENTHNMGGGRIFPQADVLAIGAVAKEHGLGFHLDGARLWNAAVATGLSEAELAAPFDTVSVCFSKGLGAPVGSALAGSAERMENALRLRKMLGGGMRQVGVLAAAARYGLEHHRDRLAEDHDAASRLGRALQGLSGVTVAPVETNIVVAEVADAERVVGAAKAQGVVFSAISPRAVRMVTHLDVSGSTFDKAIVRVVAGFREAGHV